MNSKQWESKKKPSRGVGVIVYNLLGPAGTIIISTLN